MLSFQNKPNRKLMLKQKKEAEEKAKLAAEEEQAKQEADAKAKKEAEEKARLAAEEEQAKQEADAKAKKRS